ncbi:hypothetical protein DEJ02_15740 [Curtobacterium sp. MCLR17_042]|nr:hypothetical protein DEJ02_15740 [Curtobacterium sp. MCLR17_042]
MTADGREARCQLAPRLPAVRRRVRGRTRAGHARCVRNRRHGRRRTTSALSLPRVRNGAPAQRTTTSMSYDVDTVVPRR